IVGVLEAGDVADRLLELENLVFGQRGEIEGRSRLAACTGGDGLGVGRVGGRHDLADPIDDVLGLARIVPLHSGPSTRLALDSTALSAASRSSAVEATASPAKWLAEREAMVAGTPCLGASSDNSAARRLATSAGVMPLASEIMGNSSCNVSS